MNVLRLVRKIVAALTVGGMLATPGPSEDISWQELEAHASYACHVAGQGGDPVGRLMATSYDYRLSAAVAVYAVEWMCPELGLPVDEGDALRDREVRALLRGGWIGIAEDGEERLYPHRLRMRSAPGESLGLDRSWVRHAKNLGHLLVQSCTYMV